MWFLLPIIGVTAVAETLIRLSVVVFNREQGREEWQVAVASTMKDHIVVILSLIHISEPTRPY